MANNRFITLTGTEFADFIKGTKHQEIIYAGAGDDMILSGDSRDIIYAGDGNDTIWTSQGFDTIHGGAGDDTIYTGLGQDNVYGGEGDDYVKTGRGRDEVDGGDGNDTIIAGRGEDTIHGGDGDDRIHAGRDNDIVYAEGGDDTIIGGRGNDRLDGGDGFDLVIYRGHLDDYQLTAQEDGTWNIRSYFSQDIGRDILSHVEFLYFEDDDIYVYLIPQNTAPLANDDTVTTTEDTQLLIDPAILLENDTDAENDILTISDVAGSSTLGAQVSYDESGIHYDPQDLFQSLSQGETIEDSFYYTITDEDGETSTATVTVVITGTNDAPQLSVTNSITVAENTTYVATAQASDIDEDTVLFEISGGEDAQLFMIDANSGALSFVDAPDYETPNDQDGDNSYSVAISAVDEWGGIDTKTMTVTVSDVDETPEVQGRINELHYNNQGSDVGEFVEARIRSGDDISMLELQVYDATSGQVIETCSAASVTKTSDAGFDYYVFRFEGDTFANQTGYALVNGDTVLEFLSHEGRFVATDGAAIGLRATDIAVMETETTLIGQSLQRNEDGTWRETAQQTAGTSNDIEPELNVRLNEIHYDNASTDENEFIEVRTTIGTDITDIAVYLYNGSTKSEYGSKALSDFNVTHEGGYSYYSWDLPVNGLQNGGAAADGIALAQGDTVLEFISYEGKITAQYGIAAGITSHDIHVREGNSTTSEESVQRNTFGVWTQPTTATKGAANQGDFDIQLDARINEIHYDNDGLDIGEFVEIRVVSGQSIDNITLELYNGGNGAVYQQLNLSDYDLASSADGFDFYVIDNIALQDGSPDGMALAYAETVIEFLSYEGEFTAQDGSAKALISYDIGVSESEYAAVGTSLQRNDDGTWFDSSAETRGTTNNSDVMTTDDFMFV